MQYAAQLLILYTENPGSNPAGPHKHLGTVAMFVLVTLLKWGDSDMERLEESGHVNLCKSDLAQNSIRFKLYSRALLQTDVEQECHCTEYLVMP